jgi:hypothetical protein
MYWDADKIKKKLKKYKISYEEKEEETTTKFIINLKNKKPLDNKLISIIENIMEEY